MVCLPTLDFTSPSVGLAVFFVPFHLVSLVALTLTRSKTIVTHSHDKPTKYNNPQYTKLVRFFGFIDVHLYLNSTDTVSTHLYNVSYS